MSASGTARSADNGINRECAFHLRTLSQSRGQNHAPERVSKYARRHPYITDRDANLIIRSNEGKKRERLKSALFRLQSDHLHQHDGCAKHPYRDDEH